MGLRRPEVMGWDKRGPTPSDAGEAWKGSGRVVSGHWRGLLH